MNNNYVCRKCKHVWISRTEKPQQCPRCKRYDWNVSLKELKGEQNKNE